MTRGRRLGENRARWIPGPPRTSAKGNGSPAAWPATPRRTARCTTRIAAYFRRSGFRQADADDLLQETFLRVCRSLHTFDAGRGAFGVWLATIARNVARKAWGRRREPDSFDPEIAEDVLAGPDNPGHDAAQREEVDALRDCVEQLPEGLRRIVRLRYVEARTTRGVSGATGIPEATVRLRLSEARQKLEQCLRLKGVAE